MNPSAENIQQTEIPSDLLYNPRLHKPEYLANNPQYRTSRKTVNEAGRQMTITVTSGRHLYLNQLSDNLFNS